MIIGSELLTFEEVNGCLVELQHNDLVQEVETLDVAFSLRYALCQLRDLVHLAFLRTEESREGVFAIFQRAQCVLIMVALLDLRILALIHFVTLVDGFNDGFQVDDLELQPATHDSERVLHLFVDLLPLVLLLRVS